MSYEIGQWIPLENYKELPAIMGIYILRNKLNYKEYVGQSENIRKRVGQHTVKLTIDRYLYRAMKKDGLENFEVCVHSEQLKENLHTTEIAEIVVRGCKAPEGYNLTVGGEGRTGAVCSPETRDKLRKANLGKKQSSETVAKRAVKLRGRTMPKETVERIRLANVGKTVSDETREKLRLCNVGKAVSEETREKLSKARLGHEVTQETRELIRAGHIGKAVSEEAKAAMSKAQIARHERDGRVLLGPRTTPMSDQGRANISKAQKLRRATQEVSAETRAKLVLANSGENSHRKGKPSLMRREVLLWENNGTVPKVFPAVVFLADYLGVTRFAVMAWCNDKVSPRQPIAVAYAN